MSEEFYVGAKLDGNAFTYFFSTKDGELKKDELVVVETSRGLEVAEISFLPKPIKDYSRPFKLKEILRRATSDDILLHNENKKRGVEALKSAKEFVNQLKLDMRILSASFSLDGSKLTFTFVADERIDFRELVKLIAHKYRCRIELKQIGPRDKAKTSGGIGVCGLTLCCSTFLSEIDTISINRAKNQMLSLNIPKLSGPCGKLLCCLSYEDEIYTELKKQYPKIGETLKVNGNEYRVDSFNILVEEIRLSREDEVISLPLEEYKQLKGKDKFKRKNEEE